MHSTLYRGVYLKAALNLARKAAQDRINTVPAKISDILFYVCVYIYFLFYVQPVWALYYGPKIQPSFTLHARS